MIHCTLTQNKLRVEQDTDVLPFRYSNNINIQFIKDSTYENYVVTPYYAWVPTKSIPPRKLDAFALPLKDGVFTLPMNAFVKDGYLGVAFSLTDGNEVLQTDPVYLAVQSSVGSNNILPENDSWQLVVIDTVNSYIELNVNDKLQALIKEAAKLDENSAELQREVNELIDKVNKMLEDGDFIPEHKWENTFLHFKNPDGSWDNGVNLKGPSGVYFGNDTPPEDGEYNVWVLPDGTPDFEIYADQVKTQDGSNVQNNLNQISDDLNKMNNEVIELSSQGYLQVRLVSNWNVASTGQTDKKMFPFTRKVVEIGTKMKLDTATGGVTFLENGFVEIEFNLINYTVSTKTGLIAISPYINDIPQLATFMSPPEHYRPVYFSWIGEVKKDDVFRLYASGDSSTTISTNFHGNTFMKIKFQKYGGGK